MKNFKRIKNLFLLLIGLSIILSSCNRPSKSLTLIPKTSNLVMVFNPKALIEKGDLGNLMDDPNFSAIINDIKSEEPASGKLMDKIIKDPTETGINLKSDIFFYHVSQTPNTNYFCLSMELKDKNKFNDFIFEANQTAEYKPQIVKNISTSYCKVDDNVVIAWDEDKAILIFATDDISSEKIDFQVTLLFALNKNDQISNNEQFNKFYKDKKDIGIWGSTNIIKSVPDYQELIKNFKYNIFDSYFSGSVSFEKGEIVSTFNFTPNEEMKKMYEKYGNKPIQFNEKILNYFPENSLGFFTASSNMNAAVAAWDELFATNQEFIELEQNLGISFKELFAGLGGSFMINFMGGAEIILPNSDVPVTLPLIGVAFDLKNTQFLDKIVPLIPKEMVKEHPNFKEVATPIGISLYYQYNNNMCLITNDLTTISGFNSGSYGPKNMSQSKFASFIKKYPAYGYMEMNTKKYPQKWFTNIGEEGTQVMDSWNQFGDHFEIYMTDSYSCTMKMKTMKSDENSLKGMVRTIITINVIANS
jgi:hypothetical protein